MQYVRCDGTEDVGVRKVDPEWLIDRFDTSPATGLSKDRRVIMYHCQSFKNRNEIPWLIDSIRIPQLVRWNRTGRALPALHTGRHDLLQVVRNVGRQNCMAPASQSITTRHTQSMYSS